MKRLAGVFVALGLLLTSWLGLGLVQPVQALPLNLSIAASIAPSPILAAERRNIVEEKLSTRFGEKIDLNNSNVRAFSKLPGMYPTLARMIVKNGPFDSVDNIFDMPGLTEQQKQVLETHRDKFFVTKPIDAFVEGGDRFNNGIYGG
ncbi:MAG: photosystem II complex extrinsic protein PsbU [Synechococcales bacterium]|nr:photosystem II complex extrinsic protein PsbU [Synechococcales bacterium]